MKKFLFTKKLQPVRLFLASFDQNKKIKSKKSLFYTLKLKDI